MRTAIKILIFLLIPMLGLSQRQGMHMNAWMFSSAPSNYIFNAGYEETNALDIQFPAALVPEYRSSSAENTTGAGYTPFARDNTVSSSGAYAIRISIMEAYIHGDRYRAERTFYNLNTAIAEQWHRVDYHLPEDFEKDANTTQMWQFHSNEGDEGYDGSDGAKIPAACWFINGDGEYDLNLAYNKNNPTTGWTDFHWTSGDTPALGMPEDDYGKWTVFIIHARWDYRPDAEGGDGLFELWKDGVKVVTYNGPVGYNDALGVYFKWGLMKLGWDMVGTEQHVWFDNVRVADSDASYAEMATASLKTIPANLANLVPAWKENYYITTKQLDDRLYKRRAKFQS